MNGLQIFAFVVLPIIVVMIGATASWLHMRYLKAAELREREEQLKS